MTRTAIAIEDKDVDEGDNLVFDYTRNLNPLETIVSATVTVTLVSGTDGTPAAILSGVPQVYSTNMVIQKMIGGVPGCAYDFKCLALTSTGRTLAIAAIMNVVSL